MSKLRVHNMVVTLDGFATGEGQSLDAAFGHAHALVVEPTGMFAGAADPRAVIGSAAGA